MSMNRASYLGAYLVGNSIDGWNVEAVQDTNKVVFTCASKEEAEDLRCQINSCSWMSVTSLLGLSPAATSEVG